MKTSELTGTALDWAVAKCEQVTVLPKMRGGVHCTYQKGNLILLAYSTDWSQGGPIIEREYININHPNGPDGRGDDWVATWKFGGYEEFLGPTPLIAAMRCYVAIKLGEEVEVPEEL